MIVLFYFNAFALYLISKNVYKYKVCLMTNNIRKLMCYTNKNCYKKMSGDRQTLYNKKRS